MTDRPKHGWSASILPAPDLDADDLDSESSALVHPGPAVLLEAVLSLNRTSGVEAEPDDVVHAYISTLGRLFPDRMFCVRLFDLADGNMSMVYATGRLNEVGRHQPNISRSALRRHGISDRSLPETVKVEKQYVPLFEEGKCGFDVPLMDGTRLSGMLAVEYAKMLAPPERDGAWIVQLAMQLASALRNARLHRESEYLRGYLSKLLDHANAPIMVTARDGTVSLANRALLAATGLSRDEVIGQEWTRLFPRSEQARMLPFYSKALKGEPSANVDVRLSVASGGSAHMSLNIASVLGPDREVEGVIKIFRDITEVRELQEQIIQSEKLATLGQLAAGVVHELNNPLTSISVYGEYLVRKHSESGDPDDVAKLSRIVESADRILKFSRDLVSYARPTTEAPAHVVITDVVEQAVVFCEHVLEEVGATLERSYAESLPPVYGVRGQLVQVWVNLITNACHAMPIGAGRLRLEVSSVAGPSVSVRVHDNGPGIPEENVDRLFEPFFSTKGEGKGTGLGLSIVRKIVHQHEGTVRVTSEVGHGTCMEVILPTDTETLAHV